MGAFDSAVSLLNSTKEAFRTKLSEMGASVDEATPFREYAEAIRSLTGKPPEELNLQEMYVVPDGSRVIVTADDGYDGLSLVTIEGDPNLIAENIAKGIKIYGIRGTAEFSPNDLPPEIQAVVVELDEAYRERWGEEPPADYFVLVDDEANVTKGYLFDFEIKWYDPATTNFAAIGWRRVSYHTTGESAEQITTDDFTAQESGGWNYLENIRACTREALYHNGAQVWPSTLYLVETSGDGYALYPDCVKRPRTAANDALYGAGISLDGYRVIEWNGVTDGLLYAEDRNKYLLSHTAPSVSHIPDDVLEDVVGPPYYGVTYADGVLTLRQDTAYTWYGYDNVKFWGMPNTMRWVYVPEANEDYHQPGIYGYPGTRLFAFVSKEV